MINLLAETMHDIVVLAHKRTDDVVRVRSHDGEYAIRWHEFAKVADKLYDNDFGAVQVPIDLIVEFADGSYLERKEYDGSEGWRYIQPLIPVKPLPKNITKLVGDFRPTVADLNNPNEWDENGR